MTNKHRWIKAVAGTLALIFTLFFAAAVASAQQGSRRIPAHSTQEFTMWVSGPSEARLVVDGDGDTDLDLYVYDGGWELLDSDDDRTDYCVARWHQRQAGRVRVVVVNLGDVYNDYRVSLTPRPRGYDSDAP